MQRFLILASAVLLLSGAALAADQKVTVDVSGVG